MNLSGVAKRTRDRAARSPLIRKLAGKPPLSTASSGAPGPDSNASVWTIGDESIWAIRERYEGSFEIPSISYGTVRDFADSAENLPGLAGANFDMKDMQRCWMTKAILGNIPHGGRILEIGAGEPLVAGTLSRLGYDVTIVDPYDGSGNGPREYQLFSSAYPDLRFIREQFPPDEKLVGSFDAIYSISVLEHVPLEAIDSVVDATREFLDGRGGRSIHAIDHVLAGWGAEEHLEKLRRIAVRSGLNEADLEEVIRKLQEDPETYFVSAESHNRWRGDLPYDDYAMRRIVSVNLVAGA